MRHRDVEATRVAKIKRLAAPSDEKKRVLRVLIELDCSSGGHLKDVMEWSRF